MVKVVHNRLVTYYLNRSGHAAEMMAEDQVFVLKVMAQVKKNIALASSYQVVKYNHANSKFVV